MQKPKIIILDDDMEAQLAGEVYLGRLFPACEIVTLSTLEEANQISKETLDDTIAMFIDGNIGPGRSEPMLANFIKYYDTNKKERPILVYTGNSPSIYQEMIGTKPPFNACSKLKYSPRTLEPAIEEAFKNSLYKKMA